MIDESHKKISIVASKHQRQQQTMTTHQFNHSQTSLNSGRKLGSRSEQACFAAHMRVNATNTTVNVNVNTIAVGYLKHAHDGWRSARWNRRFEILVGNARCDLGRDGAGGGGRGKDNIFIENCRWKQRMRERELFCFPQHKDNSNIPESVPSRDKAQNIV